MFSQRHCQNKKCFNEVAFYTDLRITKVLLQQCRYVPTSFNHRVQQVHAGEHVGFGLSGPEHLQFFGTARIVVVIVLRDVIAVISHSTQSQCSQSTIQSSPVRLFSSKPKNLIAILCVGLTAVLLQSCVNSVSIVSSLSSVSSVHSKQCSVAVQT